MRVGCKGRYGGARHTEGEHKVVEDGPPWSSIRTEVSIQKAVLTLFWGAYEESDVNVESEIESSILRSARLKEEIFMMEEELSALF